MFTSSLLHGGSGSHRGHLPHEPAVIDLFLIFDGLSFYMKYILRQKISALMN